MNLSFETKLNVMTGHRFRATDNNTAVCFETEMTPLDRIVFQQIGRSAPCSVADGAHYLQFSIDKSQVDQQKFDQVYDWKKQDIVHGMETAAILSEATGLELTSDHGVLFLFNAQTDVLVNMAIKTKVLEDLTQAAADMGYERSFIMDKDKPGGLAFYRVNAISPFCPT